MGKGLPHSVSRGNPQVQETIKQNFKLKNLALQVDGATGVGFGTAVIGDFPQGNILFLGAMSYLQFTATSASGITTTYDGDYSVGTVATADTDVSDSGEADIIASTALGAATAKVSPVVRGVGGSALVGVIFDNTDGSLELNLNLLIDDADISADDIDFTVTGNVMTLYSVLMDD